MVDLEGIRGVSNWHSIIGAVGFRTRNVHIPSSSVSRTKDHRVLSRSFGTKLLRSPILLHHNYHCICSRCHVLFVHGGSLKTIKLSVQGL
jgi:hypothetical protein